ncbi:hypothetical protein PENTCL1PPCAC_2106, partial [Pristionchus entomophagus]
PISSKLLRAFGPNTLTIPSPFQVHSIHSLINQTLMKKSGLCAVHILESSSYPSAQSFDPSQRYLMGTHCPDGHSNGCKHRPGSSAARLPPTRTKSRMEKASVATASRMTVAHTLHIN